MGGSVNPDSIVSSYNRNIAISEFGNEFVKRKKGETAAEHAARVTAFAQSRKSDLDRYIEPINPLDSDSLYSYAAISDDQIKDIKTYYGDLVKTRSDFDSNINLLEQGLAKVQADRGKPSKFRDTSGDYYTNLMAVPITKLKTFEQSLASQKQSITDREATRGVALSEAKKASLTKDVTSLKSQAESISKQAAIIMARGVNDANNNHTKIEVRESKRNYGRKQIAQANQMYAQASVLLEQSKQKEQYRDTGIDPTHPTQGVITSQIGGIDNKLGLVNLSQNFLTGKSSKFEVDNTYVSNVIDSINSIASKDIGTLQTQLAKLKASNRSARTGYGWGKVKNQNAIIDQHNAAEQALQNQINARSAQAQKKIAEVKISQEKGEPITIATRGQTGMIDVAYESVFRDLGVDIASEIKKQKIGEPGTKLSTLESDLSTREATQKKLITDLKVAQTERVKEVAAARVTQLDKMVAQRAITRRDAIKIKNQIAKEVSSQHSAINSVDDSVPIPDITQFDNDLRSEAQKILDSTEGIIKEQKKANVAARLRQVTRARKPQTSPVGEILARGTIVPRPSSEFLRTSLGGNLTSGPKNPFIRQ
jgi:hypothetical protein